ncbi:hypothetical protein FKM82_014903 [Ascaphus truei]
MWPVSAPALLAVLSPRMEQLAQARGLSREWREDRSVYSTVTEGAKLACATPRTMQLAKPKNHSTSSRPETHSNQSSRSEKSVGYTARTETLACKSIYKHVRHQEERGRLALPARCVYMLCSSVRVRLVLPALFLCCV